MTMTRSLLSFTVAAGSCLSFLLSSCVGLIELISSRCLLFDQVVSGCIAPVKHPRHPSSAFAGLNMRRSKRSSGNPIISHRCKQPLVSTARWTNVVSLPSILLVAVFFMCIHNESMLKPRFICLHDALLLALIFSLKTQKKRTFFDPRSEKCSLEWRKSFCWPNWSLRRTTQL